MKTMQSPSNNNTDPPIYEEDDLTSEDKTLVEQPVYFRTDFEGFMDMYSDGQQVGEYLQAHEKWFSHCAEPMKAEPFGKNGYTLTVGRFVSLGYEVEPKMSVILEPSLNGKYVMRSVPTADYIPPGYKVDYESSMILEEVSRENLAKEIKILFQKKGIKELPSSITKVNWQLHLQVAVRFPKFIYRLPKSLLQTTGDALLSQIIRQISPHLSYKVQEDFHHRFNLPIPPKTGRRCWKMSLETELLR